jgi:hypothetical protein
MLRLALKIASMLAVLVGIVALSATVFGILVLPVADWRLKNCTMPETNACSTASVWLWVCWFVILPMLVATSGWAFWRLTKPYDQA